MLRPRVLIVAENASMRWGGESSLALRLIEQYEIDIVHEPAPGRPESAQHVGTNGS